MRKHLWPIVFVAFCIAIPACAQPDHTEAPAQGRVATVSVAETARTEGLIKLDVLVVDAHGEPVPDLKPADFILLEEGRRQKILSFEAFSAGGTSSEPPVKVILVIDTMDMSGLLAKEESSAVETYLREHNGQLARRFSVYLLDNSALRKVAPADDGTMLASEIEHNEAAIVRQNTGITPFFSGLQALGQIAINERTKPGRKLLLWVGPSLGLGSGNFDWSKMQHVLERFATAQEGFYAVCWFSTLLREAQLALYSFNVGKPVVESNVPDYRMFLKAVTNPRQASLLNVSRNVLAVQSGGLAIEPTEDLMKAIESCVYQAGPFYRISFNPLSAEHSNEYHALTVVVDRLGLAAHTSTGFYDQPYYSTERLHPLKPLSVQQLGELLASSRRESDAKLAEQLSGMELTERLSEGILSRLDASARGKQTRQELQILADASVFLDPPADEIPTEAPPSPEMQKHILSLTSEYLSETIHMLPNFFAQQTTLQYRTTPEDEQIGTHYQPLHLSQSSWTTVYYRDGREITEAEAGEREHDVTGLITYGVFGPVLTVVSDAINANGGLTWSHWEQNGTGKVAVFHYLVPADKSAYVVQFCCLPDGNGRELLKQFAGYRGEVAIDAESGAVLRLEFEADLKSTTLLAGSELMIRYGRVEIGGNFYICPLRSVSISRGRMVQSLSEWDEGFRTYGPYATMLNETRFDRYHVFASQVRVLPEFTPIN